MTEEEQLRSAYNSLVVRCRGYRLAHNALREENAELVEKHKQQLAAARRQNAEELMLLKAQLRARDEELAVKSELLASAETWCAQQKQALELLKTQVQAKDAIARQLDEERKRSQSLQSLNTKIMCEMRELSDQLAAQSSCEEAAKQAGELRAELAQAKLRLASYEASLEVLRAKVGVGK